MFTLAQYVFGIGKQQQPQYDESINNPYITFNPQLSNEPGTQENSTDNHVQQENIENDWILIGIDEDDQKKPTENQQKTSTKQKKQETRRKVSGNTRTLNNFTRNNGDNEIYCPSRQNENGSTQKSLQTKQEVKKINETDAMSLENLPESMSVFDNLFVKKAPIGKKQADQPVKSLAINKVGNNKANITLVGHLRSKKKANNRKSNTTENNQCNVPLPFNNNNSNNVCNKQDLNAIAEKAKLFRKTNSSSSIKKKNSKRQNKVAVQRNGPINRQQKMFVHMNGILNNRNAC